MENLTCDNKCSPAEELLKYGKKRNGYKGFYQLVFKRVVDIIVCPPQSFVTIVKSRLGD